MTSFIFCAASRVAFRTALCAILAGIVTIPNVALTSPRAKWSILVYMNADNNLEPEAILNLNQMETVGSSDELNLVAVIRRHPGYDFSNGDWSSTRRFRVQKDDDPLTVTSPAIPWPCASPGCVPAVDSDEDLGDIAVFKNTVSWFVTQFPAEKMAIVFWGHGSGFRAEAEAPVFRGMEKSERTGKRLSTQDLGEGVKYAAALNGRPLDLVIFDACYMQMLEIAAELEGSAAYLLGSQDLVPPAGLPYHSILKRSLNGVDAAEFGRLIVEEFSLHYTNISVTLSLVHINTLEALRKGLREFSESIIRDSDAASKLRAAYNKTQKFRFADYIDFLNFLDNLALVDPSARYMVSLENLRKVAQAVIVESLAQGPTNKNAAGLSVYFPQPYMIEKDYDKLRFGHSDFGWLSLITAYAQPNLASLLDRAQVLDNAGHEQLGISPERLALERRRIGDRLRETYSAAGPFEKLIYHEAVRKFDTLRPFVKPGDKLEGIMTRQ